MARKRLEMVFAGAVKFDVAEKHNSIVPFSVEGGREDGGCIALVAREDFIPCFNDAFRRAFRTFTTLITFEVAEQGANRLFSFVFVDHHASPPRRPARRSTSSR